MRAYERHRSGKRLTIVALAGKLKLRLPDFIGVGPERTGTSWLDELLRAQACLPDGIKETYFFNRRHSNGIEWYAWHFRACGENQRAGEVCPYFSFPQAPQLIARYIPQCKIICTLRDPVDRAYSHYRMLRYYEYLKPVSFEDSLTIRPHLADSSRYAYYLVGWRQKFGTENVLITDYDDLRSDPQGYMDAICRFIGCAPIIVPAKSSVRSEAINAKERAAAHPRRAINGHHFLDRLRSRRAYRAIEMLDRAGLWKFCFGGGEVFPPLSADVEERLRERFRPEVVALEDLLGRDFSAWKEPRIRDRAAGAAAGS
ncbi:MAG TPA: sulfotransferase domain-containing protein [Candidatus Binataceae bacterium]|nr:sulfotransferase domain-containing protein [Candidatus Binataceae bacterium]